MLLPSSDTAVPITFYDNQGNQIYPNAIAFDAAGNTYMNTLNDAVYRFTGIAKDQAKANAVLNFAPSFNLHTQIASTAMAIG